MALHNLTLNKFYIAKELGGVGVWRVRGEVVT